MKKYIIVSGYISSLEQEVNEYIEKGYKPFGNIVEKNGGGYLQAMILDKNFLRGMKLDNITQ